MKDLQKLKKIIICFLKRINGLETNGTKETIPLSSVMQELGISEKEIEETEDVVIE